MHLVANDSLFSGSLKKELLPSVMRVQTGVPQTMREHTANLNMDDHPMVSRNLDVRMSTLTQPQAKMLRGSVDASSSSKVGHTRNTHFSTGKASSRHDTANVKAMLNSTWNGTRNSMMTTVPARNTTLYKRHGTTITSELYEVESLNSNITSKRNGQGNRFSLPAKSTKKSMMDQGVRRPLESQGSNFVPARAIKVPLQHKFYMKPDEDFYKMKNLFLANCLKLKDGEEGLTDNVEQSMSNRIKAFRGGLNTLTPIKRRTTITPR